MEAIQKRVSGCMGFFFAISAKPMVSSGEQLVFRSDHRDRSGNILCVDKLFYRRANGRVPGFGGKSERRQECAGEEYRCKDESWLAHTGSPGESMADSSPGIEMWRQASAKFQSGELAERNYVRPGKIRRYWNRHSSCCSPLDTSCQQSLKAHTIKIWIWFTGPGMPKHGGVDTAFSVAAGPNPSAHSGSRPVNEHR